MPASHTENKTQVIPLFGGHETTGLRAGTSLVTMTKIVGLDGLRLFGSGHHGFGQWFKIWGLGV